MNIPVKKMKRSVKDSLGSSSDSFASSDNNPTKKQTINIINNNNNSIKSLLPRILNLPQSLFHVIFSDFLQINCLVAFDNAVCNHVDRAAYLSLLENMTIKYIYIFQTVQILKWLHQRKLRLEHVKLDRNVTKSHLVTKYPLHWPTLKSWDFTPWNLKRGVDADTFATCLLKCTSLDTLILDHNDSYNGEHLVGKKSFLSFDVNKMVRVFDDPIFCSHLRNVCFSGTSRGPFFNGTSIILSPYYDVVTTAMSKHCRNLKSIDFGRNELTPDVLEQLMRTCGASLEKIIYYHRYDFILKYCPRLTRLPDYVGFNSELIAAGQYCPNLLVMSIGIVQSEDEDEVDEPDIECDNASAIVAFEGCRNLHTLSIAHCLISDLAITRATECCKGLRNVCLSYMDEVTVHTLEVLAMNCPQLQFLQLSNLSISKQDFQSFSTRGYSFPNLMTFVSYNLDVCDRFILELVRTSPLLVILSFKDSPHITDVGMSYIAIHCRHLEAIHLENLPSVSHPDYLIEILVNNPRIKKSGFLFENSHSDNFLIFDGGDGWGQHYSAELMALLDSRA